MAVKATLDRRISIRKCDLPEGAAENIRRLLTIQDGDVAKAVARGDYGAEDLVGFLELYSEDRVYLHLPRGFATMLRSGLDGLGVELEWEDRTVAPTISLRSQLAMRAPTLRATQEQAVQELLSHRQGVLQAETGEGKTVILLEAWRRTGTKGLILVEKGHLASQWRARALEHLDVETGMIGDGVWEERDLTIAMLQTLARRRTPLVLEGFFRRFGFVAADEAHHIPAFTYRGVVELFSSRYLPGATATPLDGDWRRPIMRAMLGEIFHEMPDSGLREIPTVKIVKTNFLWEPKNKAERELVEPRALYRHVIAALEADMDRLELIAETICAQPYTSAQLVVSKRKGYLSSIKARLLDHGYDPESIFFMRGDETRAEKDAVAAIADEGSCVILATVVDEGVDIPRLDRLHLVWPQRKPLPVIQQLGRLVRRHRNKTEAIAFDYVDHRQGVLRDQARARVRDAYARKGYPIERHEERTDAAA